MKRRRRRQRIGRALTELHYQIRTAGDSPAAKALSVSVGAAVGCLPLYGLHLPICAGLARLLRLDLVRTYLAAHVGNPLTAPLLLYLELGIGRWLSSGRWPELHLGELRDAGGSWAVWALGRDLLLGSFVVALGLGALLGAVAWTVGRRWQRPPFAGRLVEATAHRFAAVGIGHWELVRGKLRWDPMYLELLRSGLLPQTGRLLDLGCGRGIVPALLATAAELADAGEWPADRPLPPRLQPRFAGGGRAGDGAGPGAVAPASPAPDQAGCRHGLEVLAIERSRRLAAVARVAAAGTATVRAGDLGDFDVLPPCQGALLLDVLHYLSADRQLAIIETVTRALGPGGVLLIREADAGRGWRFLVTRWQERLSALARGHWRQRFHYRTAAGWEALLRRHGLEVDSRPMWAGTPFANVLLVARRPAR